MTDRINDLLRGAGLDIIGMDGDELVKGNGGPHCMTRPVYRSMPA
jgi:arginine deiminase